MPAPGWKWVAGACAKCGEPREKGARCKPCRRKTLAAWYASNPQRQLDAKHRYQANHPERVAKQRSDYKSLRSTKLKEVLYLSRARTNGVPAVNPWTEMDYWQLFHIAQAARCALCGRMNDDAPLTVDHIVPVSKGGSDDRDNIQLLCLSCNSRKGTRIMSGIVHKLIAAESWS